MTFSKIDYKYCMCVNQYQNRTVYGENIDIEHKVAKFDIKHSIYKFAYDI